MRRVIFLITILVFCSELNAQMIAELPDLQKPHPIKVVNNKLFIVDQDYRVLVYSIDPFMFKNTIGRKGDGIEDFKYPVRIFPGSESIVATDFIKTLWFSKTGKFIKSKNYSDFKDFDTNMEMLLFPVKDNYVRITVDHDLNKRYVFLLDSNFELIKKLHEGSYNWNSKEAYVPRINTVVYNDKIFISDSGRGFFINVYDYKGNHIRAIDKSDKFEKIKISKNDEEKYFEEFKLTQPEWVSAQVENTAFPEFYPQLHHFEISNNKIYATTYKKKDNNHELIVLDLDGNVLMRVFLPLKSKMRYRRILRYDLFSIENDTVYELIKNDQSGIWELHKTEIK